MNNTFIGSTPQSPGAATITFTDSNQNSTAETEPQDRYSLSHKHTTQHELGMEEESKRHWSTMRRKLLDVLEMTVFDYGMHCVVFLNVVIMIPTVDDSAMLLPSPMWRWLLSQVLVWVFAVEIMLRLYVHRAAFFHVEMNNVDFAVVAIDVAAFFLEFAVSLPSTSVVRVLRLSKLLRAGRLLKNCREIEVMFGGLVGAVKAIAFGSILIGMLLLVWAIIAVEILHPLVRTLTEEGVYADCERCQRAFASVGDAAVTFVQQIIAGDGWGVVCMPLIERYPLLLIFFIIVIMSVDMGILNLLLSAIVDNVHERREQNEQLRLSDKNNLYNTARKNLTKLCHDMDADGNGQLTFDEIKRGYCENGEFFNMLHMMDVEPDDMSLIFKALDGDGSGSVSYGEFVNELHKLKSQDTHSLLVFIKCSLREFSMNQQQSLDRVKDSLKTDAEMHKVELKLLRSELAATESLREAMAVSPNWQELHQLLPELNITEESRDATSAEVLRDTPTTPTLSTSAESPCGDCNKSDATIRSLAYFETNGSDRFGKCEVAKDACKRSPQKLVMVSSQDKDSTGSFMARI